jgi:hypothetical protein
LTLCPYIYSFGIVLWEIETRQLPFSGPDYRFDASVEDAVLNGIRPMIPDETYDDLRNLIEDCWQTKPKGRPSFTDIVPRLHTIVYQFLQIAVNSDIFRKLSEAPSTETTSRLHEMLSYYSAFVQDSSAADETSV